jgi:hypothetical protein
MLSFQSGSKNIYDNFYLNIYTSLDIYIMEEKRIIGRVYKLTSSQTCDVYIGSTTQLLPKRLTRHKHDYKRYICSKRCYTSAVEVLKHGDVTIELIYEGSFTTINELRRLEGSFIKETENCINKFVAGRTDKEYRQDNKEWRKEYKKEYYQVHKKQIKECNKEYRQTHKEQYKEYKKEYRQIYKEQLKEYDKEYRQTHKEQLKEYYETNKDKINVKSTCEMCGVVYMKRERNSHEKSQRHLKAVVVESKTEED